MNEEWKKFLENRGAEFSEGAVDTFGNPERELRMVTSGNVLADLSHWGLIAASGDDTVQFLQGQLTSDQRAVDAHHSQYSGACSPKGRLLATFLVFERSSSRYLMLPREMLGEVLKRLRMYVLASKVTLEDSGDALVCAGFSGPDAENELRQAWAEPPGQVHEVQTRNHITVVRIPGPHPRFILVGESASMCELWTALDVRSAPVGRRSWSLLDILAGVPVIVPDTVDQFVPQMTNLQLVDGVSFNKGCYTGQEVVARTQYLGKLKRRMYRGRFADADQVSAGMPLFSDGGDGRQARGRVLNVAPSPDGGDEVLVVAEIGAAEKHTLHLGSPDGPPMERGALPYAYPPAAEKPPA